MLAQAAGALGEVGLQHPRNSNSKEIREPSGVANPNSTP